MDNLIDELNELKARIKALEAQLAEPAPQVPQPGDVVLAWDYEGAKKTPEVYGGHYPNGRTAAHMVSDGSWYFYAIPHPNYMRWIEWKGGECPVAGETEVVALMRCGDYAMDGKIVTAGSLEWSWYNDRNDFPHDIVAYAVITTPDFGEE